MTYGRAAWLFLRLLGIVYLAAFWSFGVQVRGLIGHDGILPAATLMTSAAEWANDHHLSLLQRMAALPTICWFGASDPVLESICIGGSVSAALLVLGVAPIVF